MLKIRYQSNIGYLCWLVHLVGVKYCKPKTRSNNIKINFINTMGWAICRLKFVSSVISNLSTLMTFYSVTEFSVLSPLNVLNRFELEKQRWYLLVKRKSAPSLWFCKEIILCVHLLRVIVCYALWIGVIIDPYFYESDLRLRSW